MENLIDYEHTFKIELLNELSNRVHARLLNFVIKKGIDSTNNKNFYACLLEQFSEMLNVDLFKMTNEELENAHSYWEKMNNLTKEITKDKSE
ncbi:hypothetical protein [Bacillus toyonensis]|uniref:hypothetical protein n=1 Tax=Bacillus toyonensis TaxID=155322 RepID=UPI000BF491A1|nr:hypothetical protein [Bacillus toyonensis]PFX53374.1 hypothetical protein COL34_16045 [Bacillus toyonensis]